MPPGNGPFAFRLDLAAEWLELIDWDSIFAETEAVLVREDYAKKVVGDAVAPDTAAVALILDRHVAREILEKLNAAEPVDPPRTVSESNIGAIMVSLCNFLRRHPNFFGRVDKDLDEVRDELGL